MLVHIYIHPIVHYHTITENIGLEKPFTYLFQLSTKTLVGYLEDIIDQFIGNLGIPNFQCSLSKQ